MNQEIIDSLSLFIAYTALVPAIFGFQHYFKTKEFTNKQLDAKANSHDEESQQQKTSINSPTTETKTIEKTSFLELFQLSREIFKQNKQSFEVLRIAQFILYISNYLMIVCILNGYHGIDDFNKSCWIIGLLIGPAFNLVQLTLLLFSYLITMKILKRPQIVNFDIYLILIGYFYFILGNLIIVASINGNDSLTDKAFSVFGISYIWEIILNFIQEVNKMDITEKLNRFLKGESK